MANEGSEIFLCASDSGHEEEVIVDKSVSIVGPGSENYVLIAPTNTAGFTITADNVSISGVAVDSTRSGVEIANASNVQLDDIQVLASGNWGIKATDSSDTTVTNATLMANGYGGVQVDGGSATISTSDLSGNTGYGAMATGGAILTLNDNTISSTTPDEMGDGSDGIGVRAEDSSEAHLSGNQISGNALVNVWADSSDLSMSGDVVVGALYGIAGLNGQVDLADVTITDSFLYGLLASSQDPVTVQGCTVYGDPDATQNVPDDEDGDGYAEWGGEEYGYSGTGLYLVGRSHAQ